jgi:cytochrome c peroxidase
MLTSRGVIRVGRPIPANAEFELVAVNDPYGFASAAELSLFRRPLASSNLRFSSTVMWDSRETQPDFRLALSNQANNATLGHAQALAPLTQAVRTSIVDFETALFTAQLVDSQVGRLDAAGARGGPQALSTQATVAGAFDLFNAWATVAGNDPVNSGRRAIARGQALFNNPNAGVGGLACGTCHNVANVGTHSASVLFDIGVSAGVRRTPDMPLYTLRHKATGETRETTDPGQALTTGRWVDVDHFKTPNLRGLSARAPYFHNGSARTLGDVVEFYKAVFGFAFSPSETADLVAFLRSL